PRPAEAARDNGGPSRWGPNRPCREGTFPMNASEKPEPVAPQDPGLKNSPIEADAGRPAAAATAAVCLWNGKKFSEGAVVCDNGREYECARLSGGMRWWNTGRTC